MTGAAPRLLGGRYALGPTIGTGGMAEVFLGTDTRLGRTVAVKVLRADLARDPTFQQRFRREAQSAASLSAPCIVSVFDTGEDALDGTAAVPWIVMEHVPGSTLRDQLQEHDRLESRQALEVVADVCAALQVAHDAGIVHRDVKPANIMVTPTGEVKVMDFGIARAVATSSATMTQTAAVIGTAAYLSPEQARGEHVDARSDVYSTGCLLYELLTGRAPFRGDSPVAVAYQHVREDPVPPSQVVPGLGPDVDAVVLKAMAKNPGNRYQSATAMREDLLRAAAGDPVEATPLLERGSPGPAGSARVGEPARRRPARALVRALLVLLLVTGVAAAALLLRDQLPGGAQTVSTPTVIGLSAADARTRITALGLAVGPVTEVFDERPAGTVVDQSPVGGIVLDEGAAVVLILSKGVETTAVPELVGTSQAEASARLAAAKLAVGEVVERGGNVARGQVLEVLPPAGTALQAGSAVTLVVSSALVEVPLVVGRGQQEAERLLQQAGFDVAVRTQEDAGPAGRVLSQDPVNTSARRGSTVTVVVSRRPAPVVPPPTTPPPVTTPPPTTPPVTPSATPTVPPPASPTPTAP